MTDQEKIKSYFTERRLRCLSVNMIEKDAGLPKKTLWHFLHNNRKLNKSHLKKLIPILIEFGYLSDSV